VISFFLSLVEEIALTFVINESSLSSAPDSQSQFDEFIVQLVSEVQFAHRFPNPQNFSVSVS